MGSRRVRFFLWLAPVLAIGVFAAASPLWLPAVGERLVRSDAPVKADAIVVLAGDQFGNRILKACELLREGYAPSALVDGPCCFYGAFESDLAIPFASKAGCASDRLIPLPMRATNTTDEAAEVAAELRRRGVRSFLVVTSDYHTRRAAAAFRRVADPAAFRVVAAPDKYFRAGEWWRDREARKIVFFEWSKTVASWVGL